MVVLCKVLLKYIGHVLFIEVLHSGCYYLVNVLIIQMILPEKVVFLVCKYAL
jgi:hypothetical protein